VLEEIEKIPEYIKLNTGNFSETELSVLGDRLWIENSDLFNYLGYDSVGSKCSTTDIYLIENTPK